MKGMHLYKVLTGILLGFVFTATAQTAIAQDLSIEGSEFNKQFYSPGANKKAVLNKLSAEIDQLKKLSSELEAEQRKQADDLSAVRVSLQQSFGGLSDLLVAAGQYAAELEAHYKTSLVSAEFADRESNAADVSRIASETRRLISINRMESLWRDLSEEIQQQGLVKTFTAEVAARSGLSNTVPVTRFGAFALISGDRYLKLESTGLAELAQQPGAGYLRKVKQFFGDAAGSLSLIPVDPTSGVLLDSLVARPSWRDRLEQGGLVGKVIVAMGLLAILIALYKIGSLVWTSRKVASQCKSPTKVKQNNPLGRVLAVYKDSGQKNTDVLEMQLSEAILKELPKLNSWLAFLKVIAVIAPLMGLLGTVVGMIETFQSITLFGAGDPKLMAGGISQALVTTVLGLCVAIPVVLLHTVASGRARWIQEVLEEQSIGMVAQRAQPAQ